MKKMSYLVVFLISFMFFSMHTFALSKVIITGDDVRFRSSMNTSSSSNILATFDRDAVLVLIDDNAGTGNGCSGTWIKASYGTSAGYVCGLYARIEEINEEDYTEYSEYLLELGFPESYIPYLVTLHQKYPNWEFAVMDTNLDFNTMIKKEYDGYSKGWSLFEDTGRYFDGYKSTDSWSYNYLTDTFKNNFTGGGTYWFAASKQMIAYYMDPRNFLNDRQIFMFESLSYNSLFHTKEGVQEMLDGTFMESGYADETLKKTFADAFIDAAVKHDISPYVLVSRVIQEVGSKGSTIVSGTVSGYEGYYNFYNIKAAGDSKSETIANGLKHAKEEGWNTKYKAIVGGAEFLSDGYISVGQDTLYLQKWDLIGPNYVNHQYMQNIQAPASESISTYNGYLDIGLINSNFVFTIPVFDEMPDKTTLPNKGNPNNYLSSLSVNGDYLFESPTKTKEFSLNLSDSTTSVEIAATKVNKKATINGTGSVAINSDTQTIFIKVTAQNGDVRTYKIKITRDDSIELDIGEILRTLNINNDGSYIYGNKVGTEVSNIIKMITDRENRAVVTFTDKNNKNKTSGILAAGDKIKIKTSKEEKEYTFVIYGDVNEDGKISSADYIAIKNHIMDVKKLSDLELMFADANKDSKVSSADYIAIKNHIMEVKEIVQ